MDVLVVSGTSPTRDRMVERLEGAGHTVHLCGGEGGSCGALDSGADPCPIDRGVDAAVLVPDPVRSEDRRPSSIEEVGALCAVRKAVPLVVAGDDSTAFDSVAAVLGASVESVGWDVERSQSAPMPGFELIARDALRQALRVKGLDDVRAEVTVERAGRGLRVRLHPGVEVERTHVQALSIRVHAALRAADAEIVSIAVSC